MNPASVGADYDDEQNNPDTRRCRFIAHIADVSALPGFSGISLHVFITIIGPLSGFHDMPPILLLTIKELK
jgi:hypothetical protein